MSASPARDRPELRNVDPGKALLGGFLILQAWKASAEQARVLLGSPPERTFYAWKAGRGVRVPADTLRRIGYLAGVYKALHIVYSDRALADSWVNRPNAALGGQTPLQRMLGGDVTDLAAVRACVDAARAPWS
jgi:hypothetical protein